MSSLFDTGIRPIMDDFLLEKSKEKRDYGQYWSASSAGYCQRKLIFERLGVETTQPDDPRKQRVFAAGHLFHDFVQKLTRDAGVSIAQEVELQDEELFIRGHFDDLVLIDGKLILYDIKTVNSRSFMWAKKNDNAMSYYHKMQLGTYMYMLRKKPVVLGAQYNKEDLSKAPLNKWTTVGVDEITTATYGELTEARILKIEKDTLMMGEQQLMWSDELQQEVLTYWNSLNNYWQSKKLPPCTCADQEGGFMSKEKFNPFYYEGEPCSLDWYKLWKEKQGASPV